MIDFDEQDGPAPPAAGGYAATRPPVRHDVGQVAELRRYPVKSMAGERLATMEFTERGVAGDRFWAAYTKDGGIGSGKTTQRFRRVEGLLDLRAALDGTEINSGAAPMIWFPDGQQRRADDPEASELLSDLLGQQLQLRPQSSVPHHDEAPVHLVTTAAIRQLEDLLGQPVDAGRFRSNIVLDVDDTGFVEDDWPGHGLAIGDQVVLRLGAGMPRCLMVDIAQPHDKLPRDGRLLGTLAQVHQVEFGLQAAVARGGTVRNGDVATFT